MIRRTCVVATALVALSTAACRMSPPSAQPRYFEPQLPVETAAAEMQRGFALRIAEVKAAAHLEDRLVWSNEHGEIGYYELLRWTDEPGVYLDRALGRELFEQRGFQRSARLDAPSLEVSLLAFQQRLQWTRDGLVPEEIVVQASYRLLDSNRDALREETVTCRHSLREGPNMTLAEAYGWVLHQTVAAIADHSTVALMPPSEVAHAAAATEPEQNTP